MKWNMFFQGAMFIVFLKCSGATFIQGATLIPESRVDNYIELGNATSLFTLFLQSSV